MRRAVAVLILAAGSAGSLAAQTMIRGGGIAAIATRNAAFANNVGSSGGTLTGFDLQARYRIVGLAVRVWGGEFKDSGSAAGTIANGDLRLAVGPSAIAAEVGYGRRALTGALGTVNWSFFRVGVRSSLPIGGTGVYAGLAVGIYVGANSQAGPEGSGKEAETSLTFLPPRLPLYVMLGYRIEQFTATAGSEDRPEEVSGLVFGLGVRFSR